MCTGVSHAYKSGKKNQSGRNYGNSRYFYPSSCLPLVGSAVKLGYFSDTLQAIQKLLAIVLLISSMIFLHGKLLKLFCGSL